MIASQWRSSASLEKFSFTGKAQSLCDRKSSLLCNGDLAVFANLSSILFNGGFE